MDAKEMIAANKEGTRGRTRSSNFELLRIVAMLMIIAHHLSLHGIFSNSIWDSNYVLNKIILSLFQPGGEVGVALFFMITGYFMYEREKGSIKKIWCETYFYGVVAILIFFISKLVGFSYTYLTNGNAVKDIIEYLFIPQISGIWWFVTAYIILILFLPVINPLLIHLKE